MRVLVWNVQGCRAGAAVVADAVAACAPDIACLNEVTRTDAVAIARRAGGLHVVSSARLGHRVANAVLTRAAPATAERLRLPAPRGDQRRSAAIARTGLLTVVSVHLGLTAEQRVAQMRAVLARIARPAIVGADLNEPPDGAAFALAAAILRDAGAGSGPTFPATAPRARIDACFVSDDIAVGAVRVLDAGPSDHRALLAELAVPVTA